jgi:hypothetical protein
MKTFRPVDIFSNREYRAPKTVLGGVMTPSPIRKLVDIMAKVMTVQLCPH